MLHYFSAISNVYVITNTSRFKFHAKTHGSKLFVGINEKLISLVCEIS